MPTLRNMVQGVYTEGNNTLANAQTFTGTARAVLPGFTRMRVTVFQDQTGVFTIEDSIDGATNWRARPNAATAVTAGNYVNAVTANNLFYAQLCLQTVAAGGPITFDLPTFLPFVRVKCSNTSGAAALTTQVITTVLLP